MTNIQQILRKKPHILKLLRKHNPPFYIFDRKELQQSVIDFQKIFTKYIPTVNIFYAVKSNPYPPLLSEITHYGLGLDVSSGKELKKAIAAKASKILFTGPGKSIEEIELATRNTKRVIINADSIREIEKIEHVAKKNKKQVRVGIRVHTVHHGKWNKFGIPLTDLAKAWKMAKKKQWVIPLGIQTHMSWTENAKPFENVIREIGVYLDKNKNVRNELTFIDFGGGFSMEYPLQKYARKIGASIKKYIKRDGIAYYFEPGRVLCHGAMHILLRVVDVKSPKIVITDGGTNIIGWVEDNYEPVIINLTHPAPRKKPIFIYGSLCTPEDIWGRYCFASKIKEGDHLLIPNHGAYTYTYASDFIREFPRVYELGS